MHRVRKSFSICFNNIRKWAINPRIYILGVLLVILLWNYVSPIVDFSNSAGYRVTPWVFPFLSNYYITQMLMMFGVIFLFCDAPFLDGGQPYIFIRSGRIVWAMGQVLYIMIGTAIYFLFINLVTILILCPNIFLSISWGKILNTLAQTNAAQALKINLPISYQILSQYKPVQVLGISFILEWCAGTMLGLIIFVVNLHIKRFMGTIISTAIVLFDIAIMNSFPYFFNHFSPVSMARLTILDPSGLSTKPSNIYAYTFYGIGISILCVVSVISVRKHDIKILPPV